ncbi:hypothetical protein CSC62_14180 [Pseudoxanthomonas jiangsuensis]|uniref:EF-hand domain-containing protein n=1 Tax=Pseudoxanthomonas jiangsuensis TaxID=619688 RepID=UPI001390DCB1|nr:hypothetical protein CSC62_14180 [Pseudoxanthomonas jiangsuensis]
MKKTPFLIATALLAVTAGAALAQSNTPTPAAPATPAHKPLDANKDGVIERGEAAAFPRLAERFDTLDKNRDGKLDRGELPRRPHGDRGRHGPGHRGGFGGPDGPGFAGADKDGDGRISKAEATAAAAERFDRMDANKDGFVDRADRELASQQRRDARFKALDSNGDGSLSRAEYDAAQARHGGPRGERRGGGGRGPAATQGAAAK